MPSLSDILGQSRATDVLRRAVARGKLAHAYLFSGPDGVGKATCARCLAAALNCHERPGEGCDGCVSCHKIANDLHPDLIVLRPDGAYIKIGQVRELEQHLMFAPHEGRHRVVLVDGADRLNESAANALLKSVEEPRPRTLFVLATAALHRVTPTLVSRCQRIRFAPLEHEHLLTVIADRSDAPREDQQAAAALAEGSPGRALRLLSADQMELIRKSADALLDAADSPDALASFDAAARAGKDRQLLAEVLDVLRVWLRDLLLCREGLAGSRTVNRDQLARLERQAKRLPRAAIISRLRLVNEAQAALRGNANATLALENLVLQMRQTTNP